MRSIISGLILLLGLASSWATGQLPTPEASVSLSPAALVFFQFFLFWFAVVSLGSRLRSLMQLTHESASEAIFLDLSLGSVGAYLAGHLLALAGLFRAGHSGILWGVVATAVYFRGPAPPRPTRREAVWLSLPLVLVALKLLESLQIHTHGDAYITYLPASRSWAARGDFELFLAHTQFFLSTSWETLFSWGGALMALDGGRGLDAFQWWSQWTISGIALPGLALGVASWIPRIFSGFSSTVPPLAWSCLIVSAIQVPSLRWTANLAKHDLGVCLWGFAAFHLAVVGRQRMWTGGLAAGLLAGAAFIGKLSLAPLVAVLLGWEFLFRSRGAAGRVVAVLAGGLLGALPILVRNASLTGNPFFPWLSQLFPVSGAVAAQGISERQGTLHATRLGTDLVSLGRHLWELLAELPLLPFIGLAAYRLREIRRPMIVGAASALLFILLLRRSTEIRYLGSPLIILSALSVFSVAILIARHSVRLPKRVGGLILGIFALVAFLQSGVSFHTLLQLRSPKFTAFAPSAEALADTGGPAKLWIRKNLAPDDPLLILGDGYPYYLIDFRMTQYSHVEGMEAMVANGQSEMLLDAIAASRFRNVYLSSRADYVAYQPAIAAAMAVALERWPRRCLRSTGDGWQVWNVECLR